MKNLQQAEARVTDPDVVQVHSIFPTIQGEGYFSGHPATFIRLAGCNLQCPNCDTDYTSHRTNIPVPNILNIVRSYPNRLIVVTGGEPFRQNLTTLLGQLVADGYKVVVETNGTLPPPLGIFYITNLHEIQHGGVFISCSPKTARVHPSIAENAFYFKYVLQANSVDPYDGLPIQVLNHPVKGCGVYRPPHQSQTPIYLQPADEQDAEKNEANLKAVIASCKKFNYILNLQTHKIIGVE